MASASQRTELIVFKRQATSENEYGEPVGSGDPTVLATRRARVRFGTAQEKREAAQEGGVQSATFECVRSTTLEGVLLSDFITYDGSDWDIVECAPLSRKDIRFTATRNV
jgi:hypothetical protein